LAGSSSRIMAPIVSVAAASASSDWRQLLSVWSRLHISEATLRGSRHLSARWAVPSGIP
jgi:hypothetical protein